MTAVVGILCSDGVVIGTDSSVTMAAGSFRTIEQPAEKLDIIAGRIIIAGTGSVGHGQRFRNLVDREWTEGGFRGERDGKKRTPVDVCRFIAGKTVDDFAETNSALDCYGALLVAPIAKKPVLCEFGIKRFQPTLYTDRLWFCSMGSTQPITDPFLALMRGAFWPADQPTVHQATFAVTWALDHAIEVNPGGVNGPARIAVLEHEKKEFRARLLTDEEVAEHRSLIGDVRKAMKDVLTGKPDAPPTPVATPSVD